MQNEGRVVVITGAAGGIGKALLEVFHHDGATIAAVDLPGTNVNEIAGALGARHAGFYCDVSSEDEIVDLIARIEARFGRIDALVNNAALGPTMAATVDTDLARYVTGSILTVDGGWQSFNQPGNARPPVTDTPDAELTRPEFDMGRPQDVAEAAFFLASADASYINGSILYVDGGWTSFGNAGNASDVADEAPDLRRAAE